MLRRRLAFLAVPAVLAALPAVASAAPGDLYLQQAAGGTLKGDTLTLRGVAPRITTFADRPARSATSQTTAAFVAGWARAFGDDPPNAALEIAGAPASRDVTVLELRAPRYDARHRTLRFSVRRIGTAGGGLSTFDGRADRVSGTFGRATLYIDDGALPGAQALFTITPGSGTATLSFSGSQLDFSGGYPLAGSFTALGSVAPQLVFSQTELSATGGDGAIVIAWAESASSALTGTATLPAGASATVSFGGGPATTIPNGAFSIPFS